MKSPITFNYLKRKIKRLRECIELNEKEIKFYQKMIDEILEGEKLK